MRPIRGLYFITDRSLSKNGIAEDVRQAIKGGARIVQYREKEFHTKRMIEEAREIREICRKNGTKFIVNDRVDVALASDADGVHLGPKDMDIATARKILGPKKIIGVTAGTVADAKKFEKQGADYIGLSPIFATSTKKDAGKPIGIAAITEAKKSLNIPFTAIGGINRGNLKYVLNAGAESVCMISAVMKGGVEKEVREIMVIMDEHTA